MDSRLLPLFSFALVLYGSHYVEAKLQGKECGEDDIVLNVNDNEKFSLTFKQIVDFMEYCEETEKVETIQYPINGKLV